MATKSITKNINLTEESKVNLFVEAIKKSMSINKNKTRVNEEETQRIKSFFNL